jgi:anaerobic selenocysteine-containing dehydrogenase
LQLKTGSRARCSSAAGAIEVTVEVDDSVRRGMVTLPHGYGARYRGGNPMGPQINVLTSRSHCDPLSKTPFHKYVPVRLEALP